MMVRSFALSCAHFGAGPILPSVKRLSPLALLALLAACGETGSPRVESPGQVAPGRSTAAAGLDRVMGHDARALIALFGPADRDMREMSARRLQFAGPACVLDAYLYATDGKEPVVAYLDARTPAGADFDRASCVAALTRRKAAR